MTTQRIGRKVCELGSRPEFWLIALLLWALVSAGRPPGPPGAAAARTEPRRGPAGGGGTRQAGTGAG